MSFNSVYFYNANQIQFDSNAQSYITAAGITQSFQQWAVNELIIEMKRNNIWSSMVAVYPFLGGSSASHGWNAVNTNLYRINFTNGWTHSSTGAFSNGANGVAGRAVGLTPSQVLSGSIHFSLYSRRQTKNGYTMGFSSATVENHLIPRYTDNNSYTLFGVLPAAIVSIGGQTASGFWIGNHLGGTTSLFKNGTTLASGARTLTLATQSILFSTKDNGFIDSSATEFAFASVGTGLIAASQSILWNLVNDFQTKLGRRI